MPPDCHAHQAEGEEAKCRRFRYWCVRSLRQAEVTVVYVQDVANAQRLARSDCAVICREHVPLVRPALEGRVHLVAPREDGFGYPRQ